MEFLTNSYQMTTIFQLLLAIFLGALIGLEREIKKKEAGLQTYSLVTLGSCLFAFICFSLARLYGFDPAALFIAIAVGMGFIGAGTIFRTENRVEGVTTAAGLWTTAAIGLAVGVQLYFLAIFATLFTLLILLGFGFIEKKYLKTQH